MTIRLAPDRRGLVSSLLPFVMATGLSVSVFGVSAAQTPPPALTAPVNDFANVIDRQSKVAMDSTIRDLLAATGDTVIVATVATVEPYADAKELAVTMFENRGAGIGKKGKDNGLLVLLAIRERQVWIEVGYGLEEFITDGEAGSISRQVMTPRFKQGEYGQGLRAGVDALALHIAEARGVALTGVRRPARVRQRTSSGYQGIIFFVLIILFGIGRQFFSLNPLSGGRRNRWGGGGWSGWGGGGFGGGGFGGGGGGGFGGFGGGGSGGGGGGSSW